MEAEGRRCCTVCECSACGLLFLSDYLDDRSGLYGIHYAAWGASEQSEEESTAASKREAFADQLAPLRSYIAPSGKRFLDIGTGYGYLLDVARTMDFDCFGVELSEFAAGKAAARFPGRITCGRFEGSGLASESFDVAAMTDVLEHVADPHALLAELNRVLLPGGLAMIVTPNTDSWSRRFMRQHWFQYKYEHVLYWNPRALTLMLRRHGFEPLLIRNNHKRFRLSYYSRYFRRYLLAGRADRLFLAAYGFVPVPIREWSFSNPITGEMFVIARKRDPLP